MISQFSWTAIPDGYTSAALIYKYIKELDENYPVHYIIHNNNKAHGLGKMDDGDFELPGDVKLFIIPDAGTNDVEQLNKLVGNGIDCICLDHHEQEVSDIECKAIIVNNQISDDYTCKSFSGVVIAYELARALADT
jgi:single-stranded-DNA-specific exonuclease